MVGYSRRLVRITNEGISPSYHDDEIEDVIRVVTSYALLAAYETFDIAEREDLKALVVERVNSLIPSSSSHGCQPRQEERRS